MNITDLSEHDRLREQLEAAKTDIQRITACENSQNDNACGKCLACKDVIIDGLKRQHAAMIDTLNAHVREREREYSNTLLERRFRTEAQTERDALRKQLEEAERDLAVLRRNVELETERANSLIDRARLARQEAEAARAAIDGARQGYRNAIANLTAERDAAKKDAEAARLGAVCARGTNRAATERAEKAEAERDELRKQLTKANAKIADLEGEGVVGTSDVIAGFARERDEAQEELRKLKEAADQAVRFLRRWLRVQTMAPYNDEDKEILRRMTDEFVRLYEKPKVADGKDKT